MTLNFDIVTVSNTITTDISNLDAEINEVYSSLVLPNWANGRFHGFPFALYGYITAAFARIDYMAQCSRGTQINQSNGMVAFMDRYFGPTDANRIAVHMWRHALVHTGHPRVVKDDSGEKCKWLVHWSGDQLPKEQHFTLIRAPDYRILNFALTYFIDDLKRAAQAYVNELEISEELQRNFRSINRN